MTEYDKHAVQEGYDEDGAIPGYSSGPLPVCVPLSAVFASNRERLQKEKAAAGELLHVNGGSLAAVHQPADGDELQCVPDTVALQHGPGAAGPSDDLRVASLAALGLPAPLALPNADVDADDIHAQPIVNASRLQCVAKLNLKRSQHKTAMLTDLQGPTKAPKVDSGATAPPAHFASATVSQVFDDPKYAGMAKIAGTTCPALCQQQCFVFVFCAYDCRFVSFGCRCHD